MIRPSTPPPSDDSKRPGPHLDEARERQARLGAVDRVCRAAAHALNNYLMVFDGGLEMLEARLATDPAGAARMLATLKDAAQGAERLAGALQLLRGHEPKQVEPADVSACVSTWIEARRASIGDDIEIHVEPSPTPSTACLDREGFEAALGALLDNALDAMPGGGRLRLRTRTTRLDDGNPAGVAPGTYVAVEVTDTGPGLDAEARARLFEPFFSTKRSKAHAGLGLATVWGILRQIEGGLDVESAPGRGTTVRLYVPRVGVLREERNDSDAVPSQAASGTVLVVDDETAVREFVQEVLEASGFEVLLAPSGEEALALTRRTPGPIDLLLTDVVMPGMDGKALATRFAELRPATSVLFMSGFPSGALASVSDGAPAPLLAKPFTPQNLCRRITQVLAAPAEA